MRLGGLCRKKGRGRERAALELVQRLKSTPALGMDLQYMREVAASSGRIRQSSQDQPARLIAWVHL